MNLAEFPDGIYNRPGGGVQRLQKKLEKIKAAGGPEWRLLKCGSERAVLEYHAKALKYEGFELKLTRTALFARVKQ